jgi:hypothetical protein
MKCRSFRNSVPGGVRVVIMVRMEEEREREKEREYQFWSF